MNTLENICRNSSAILHRQACQWIGWCTTYLRSILGSRTLKKNEIINQKNLLLCPKRQNSCVRCLCLFFQQFLPFSTSWKYCLNKNKLVNITNLCCLNYQILSLLLHEMGKIIMKRKFVRLNIDGSGLFEVHSLHRYGQTEKKQERPQPKKKKTATNQITIINILNTNLDH